MKILNLLLSAFALAGLVQANYCWRNCQSNDTAQQVCGNDEDYVCCPKSDGQLCCTSKFTGCDGPQASYSCTQQSVKRDCGPSSVCCAAANGESGTCTPFYQ